MQRVALAASSVVVLLLLAWLALGGVALELASTRNPDGSAVSENAEPKSADTSRHSDLEREHASEPSVMVPSFRGAVVELRGGVTAPLLQASSVLVALQADAAGCVAGELAFSSFVRYGTSAAIPVALERGRRLPVIDGQWKMEIPSDNMVLVSVRVGSVDWLVEGQRLIPSGATAGTYMAVCPPNFTLHVHDEVTSQDCERVTVIAFPEIPQGVPVNITREPSRDADSGPNVSPKRGAYRKGRLPPSGGVVLGDRVASPVTFAGVDYAREVWVGCEGRDWVSVRLPPGGGEDRISLVRPVRLGVNVVGHSPELGNLKLSLKRKGVVVTSWLAISPGALLVCESVGAGSCELVLNHHRDIGCPIALIKSFVVPDVEDFQVDLDLSDVKAVDRGSIIVGVLDQSGALRHGDEVLVAPLRDVLAPVAGVGRTLLKREGAADASTGNPVWEATVRVPFGEYLVSMPKFGLYESVVINNATPIVVSLVADLSANVTIVPWSGLSDDARIEWQCIDGAVGVLASYDLATSAVRRPDGTWNFQARPGKIAYRVRGAATGTVWAAGIRDLLPGENRLSIEPNLNSVGVLRVKMTGLSGWSDADMRDVLVALVDENAMGKTGCFPMRAVTWERGSMSVSVEIVLPSGVMIKPDSVERVVWTSVDATSIRGGDRIEIIGSWK